MNRYFISDLHLDSTVPQKLFALQAVLANAVKLDCEIYILGDLVETWIGDDDDCAFADLLRETLRVPSQRVPLYLMHGNRDFLFGQKFASEVGAKILDDPTVIEIDGERVMLSHGDVYCTSDLPYQEIRTKFRSAEWQQSFLSKTLDERRRLAATMRIQSKEAVAEKSDYITDVVEEEIIKSLQTYDCRTMIHGHTHRPGQHRMGNGCTRYVLGDWGRCGWQIYATPQIRLECFPVRDTSSEAPTRS
ncbi:MAG: UDP-2,3-diacylglucosamine diphosphatase [Gammaproteobacteria bacterium]|nr:UDP-2,3-diacylglucosamine diphosphatase [Gammaproteobacteria bacterium]